MIAHYYKNDFKEDIYGYYHRTSDKIRAKVELCPTITQNRPTVVRHDVKDIFYNLPMSETHMGLVSRGLSCSDF